MKKITADDVRVSDRVSVKITKPDGTMVNTFYPTKSASAHIVEDSTHVAGIPLTPEYSEVLTETIKRTRGFKIGVSFNLQDGFKFEVDYPPRKETRTTKKIIYKNK